jgi:tetratricopeptide (TPR) repeat protein
MRSAKLIIFLAIFFSTIPCISQEKPAEPAPPDNGIGDLKEPLYSPFVERYILDELKQVRIDMQAQRAELIEKVVEKELEVADKAMSYASNTITYFFYIILATTTLLVLAGWTSLRDIKENVKSYADQEVIRLTAEYKQRLQALEEELHHKSHNIAQAQEEIDRTNEIHSLWLKASLESSPQNKISLYDQILGLRPEDTEALTYKADAALSLDEPQWAISLCNKALEIDPENGHAFYQRACANACLGFHEQAIIDLEKAVLISPAFVQDAISENCFNALKQNRRFKELAAIHRVQ